MSELKAFSDPGFRDLFELPPPRKGRTEHEGARRSSGHGSGGGSPRMAKFMRVINRTPEVVVTITGQSGTRDKLRAHLTYLTKHWDGDARLETERAIDIQDQRELLDTLKEWGIQPDRAGRGTHAIAVHVVLSMPKATDPEAVLRAAREFAQAEFADHQFVLALHTDKEHPHVHLAINATSYQLTRLKRRREDLQRWREGFAQALRHQGIAAEATSRAARGIVKKGVKIRLHHVEQHGKSWVRRKKAEEVGNELRGVTPPKPEPWKPALAAQRSVLVNGLQSAAAELEARGEREDAAKVRDYLRSLPPVRTERDEIKTLVLAAHQRRQQQDDLGRSR